MVVNEQLRRCGLLCHPSDRVILALLSLAILVGVLRWPAVGGGLALLVVAHLGLLLVFLLAMLGSVRWDQEPRTQLIRPMVIFGIILLLYSGLGELGMVAMPYSADATLRKADLWLLGTDPSLAIQPYQGYYSVEFLSIAYGMFTPYTLLAFYWGCAERPPLEREQFLTGWTMLYAISYLGYLFLPAQGPGVFQAQQYQHALAGGLVYHWVSCGNELTGGMHGAFPSLHVGGVVYLCLSDLKIHRPRGLAAVPLMLLIYVATVFLRYHYVVDLIAGTVIALAAIPMGRWVVLAWARRRAAAGLPAIPTMALEFQEADPSPPSTERGNVLPET